MDDTLLDSLGYVEGESTMHRAVLIEYAKMAYPESADSTPIVRLSLSKVAKQTHHRERVRDRWSEQFNWVERVAAYDKAVEEWRMMLWQERRRQVDEDDWKDGAVQRNIGRLQMEMDRKRLEDDRLPLPAGEGRQYMKDGSKLQRLATGAPTERTEETLPPELQRILDEAYDKPDSE